MSIISTVKLEISFLKPHCISSLQRFPGRVSLIPWGVPPGPPLRGAVRRLGPRQAFGYDLPAVNENVTARPVVGLLHPGEMGAAAGRCLTGNGVTVLWAGAGRSAATRSRAQAAGLTEVGSASELAARAGVILSICPPHGAMTVAESVAGFRGIFADANAISPETAAGVARLIEAGGGSYADGGIIGLPPVSAGTTRLYLSGPHAGAVAGLFEGTPLAARVLDGGPFAASALKMAYAGWTKGTAALLLTVAAFAEAEGVAGDLAAEWALSQPGLADRCQGAAGSAAGKGWRWVAEMEEIAASMAGTGLPSGFHEAAAEVFRRSPRVTGQPPTDIAARVISALQKL